MQQQPGKTFLTIGELSEYLKLPEETIYKYARAGRIPASKVGRHWRFELTQIDQWVAGHSNGKSNGMKILVVDDEPMIRQLMEKWLSELNVSVTCVSGGNEALTLCETEEFDLIFLDLMMPFMNGAETLRNLHVQKVSANIVFLTSFFDSALMEKALEHGPVTILKKPVVKETLHNLIRSFSPTGVGINK